MINDELKEIFLNNSSKRICVLGTTCTGKSTLINSLGMGEDMDSLIFPLLSKEEEEYVCKEPWTEEIGEVMNNLVRTKLSIKPGKPLFGTVLLDCDLIVYLHIDDELLKERCELRGVDFINAKNMQEKIEEEIAESSIESVKLSITKNRVR